MTEKKTFAEKCDAVFGLIETRLCDQLRWHRANAPNASQASFDAYEQGFRQGWAQAFSVIKTQVKP